MKKHMLMLMLCCLLGSSAAFAQTIISNSGTSETLFGNTDIKITGYGGVNSEYSPVGSSAALWVGGRGGIIINRGLSLGLEGKGMVYFDNQPAQVYYDPLRGTNYTERIDIGYGGVNIDYTFNTDALIHYTAGFMIGAGAATLRNDYSNGTFDMGGNFNSKVKVTDVFFVFEPRAGAELNITQWMRVNVFAGYRFTNGVNTQGMNRYISNSDMNRFTAGLIFKFGAF